MIRPYFIQSIVIVILIIGLSGKSFSQESAGDYLDAISTQQTKISEDMMAYISAANHGKSARKVEKRRTEVAMQIKESERNIRKLRPFKGETRLRDSTANYLRLSYHVFNDDYGKVVDLEDIAEQSYDAMEAYLLAKEKAEEKIEQAADIFEKEYYSFAAANNIRIIEGSSKLGRRLAAARKVNDYHNVVYLIFFKSYKNEAYLMEALKQENINAIEQTRNALIASATEDLAKLGPMQGFNGDVSLKNATQNMLTFYKMEASTKIPELIDFLLTKEKFDKAKKAFESKTQSNRTKEDIDAFNNAVNEFNAKIGKSNQVGNDLNKKRATALNFWNETSESFLHKHTPK